MDSTMATSAPPPPEHFAGKQTLESPRSMPQYYDEESQKENSMNRNMRPSIPVPASGRIYGGPMSSVRINVQHDGRVHQSSSVEVQDEFKLPLQNLHDASTSDEDRLVSSEGPTAVVQNMSHRQHYITHAAQPTRAAQEAELTNTTNGSSGWSEDSPTPQIAHRSGQTSSMSPAHSEGSAPIQTVPQFQYHHQSHYSDDVGARMPRHQNNYPHNADRSSYSNPNPESSVEAGMSINRHLTPTLQNGNGRHSVIPRPGSTYSNLSDFGPRGQSPNWTPRAASANSGKNSPDNRPVSYVDLLNVPYAQQNAPAPINFDNSQLRTAVGTNASLLSTVKTLEMYRANVKKTNDPEIQYSFAIFLIQAAQEVGLESHQHQKGGAKLARDLDSPYVETLSTPSSASDLLKEARQILSRLADRSYPFAQYYLGDGYASGLFNKGKEDNDRAFSLFVAASKHGHAESGYRAALCYEFGWGCRKDPAKAVQFYRQSASKNHPGAMTRLGRACLSGDLGLNKYREGLKWLKRATDAADTQYNTAPYHLGLLYETGYGDDVFMDETYAAQLFTQAADLGHAEASYRLGDAYEHGRLLCPRDPALSVHFYTGAAQGGHPAAMMALCAWYMIGAEPVLEKDETEAYEWARRAAELGLTKAQYAVGYFTEMGIGCRRDPLEANMWYVKAAEAGDERAKHRLAAIRAAASGGNPMEVAAVKNPKMLQKSPSNKLVSGTGSPKDEKDCIVM